MSPTTRPPTYLADTSALVRIIRGQVAPSWAEQVALGRIWLCDPVLTEVMAIAPAKAYRRFLDNLVSGYPWISLPEDPWPTVRANQAQLSTIGAHSCLSVTDHLVVATAIRNTFTVLHVDDDFATAARVMPGLLQQRLDSAA